MLYKCHKTDARKMKIVIKKNGRLSDMKSFIYLISTNVGFPNWSEKKYYITTIKCMKSMTKSTREKVYVEEWVYNVLWSQM